jgi:alkylation response protein AidB-like acyl-CoA dehydrogenase
LDLSYSDEHCQFADGLERFFSKSYPYDVRRALVRRRVGSDPAIWQQLADFGCLGLAIAEDRGGFGNDPVTIGLLARAMGRHLVIEPVLASLYAGILLSSVAGGDAMLDTLVDGTARPVVIIGAGVGAGRAQGVEGGMTADHFVLATDAGLAALDTATVVRTAVPLLDDSLAADLVWASAPRSHMEPLGDWPAQRAIADMTATLFRGWQALGCLEAAVEATAAYMRERFQFGRSLGSFQVVQHRVAEMVVAAKEAEMVAMLAALTFQTLGPGAGCLRAMATMTARIAAAAALVGDTAVQLHGGMGVSDELDIAARFRHLQAFRLRASGADDPAALYAKTIVASGAHHRSAVLIEA